MLLFYANLSLALGLGEIELKSHLGEKFFAKVNVSDLEPQAEANCFTATDMGDVPAFRKANITLKPYSDGHQLTITTNEVIAEPIINLYVSFHCNLNVNREYVLLLDPTPITTGIENTLTDSENMNAELTSTVSDKNKKAALHRQNTAHQLATLPTGEAIDTAGTIKRPSKKQKPSTAITVNEKLDEAYTEKQKSMATPASKKIIENNSPSKPAASTDKPFLVISGGNANSNENSDEPRLTLRLATEIDFTRPEAAIAPPATTDAMDDATVMTNRLAHLEKQIANLQSRNTQLEAAAKAKEEKEHVNWQQMLLTALGIIVALAVAEWLRRKIFSKQAKNETAEWFDAEANIDTPKEPAMLSGNSFEASHSDAQSFGESNPAKSPDHHASLGSKESALKFEEENHGSVLDDADVFIEHGRPVLAIQLLQNHLIDSPAESPAIWFKLLNLLAQENSEKDYDEAVVECNKYFNIKAPKFDEASENDNSSIEDYPHIITRLEGVWGSPFAVGFLNDLIYNKRSQPREGLKQSAFEDLFFLKLIAKHLDATYPPTHHASFYQPIATQPTFENTSFNDALFADSAPLDDIKQAENASPNNALFDSNDEPKVKFDAPTIVTATVPAEKPGIDDNDDIFSTAMTSGEPSYVVEMLLNAETIPALDSSTDLIDANLAKDSKTSEVDGAHQAEEIHLTAPTTEIESLLKTNPLDVPEEFTSEVDASAQKTVESNSIEWDQPAKTPKSKTKP